MIEESKFSIVWQEAELDAVVRYFSNGFEWRKEEKIMSMEYFVDVYRGKVVFKMIVHKKP